MTKNLMTIIYAAFIVMSAGVCFSCNSDDDDNDANDTGKDKSMHEYVDLGLSVKWATCNIGASHPEEYGYYFAWAETEPRTGDSWNYDWDTTPYSLSRDSDHVTWSKYTGSDGKTVLDTSDDAATVNWGSPWRMPTRDEFEELINKCKWTITTVNEVEGYMVTGTNGNTIFLPAAGIRDGSNLYLHAEGGIVTYWSSSLRASYPSCAYNLEGTYLAFLGCYYNSRCCGRSVRPVCP